MIGTCLIDNISIVDLEERVDETESDIVDIKSDIIALETNVNQSVVTTSSPVFNSLKLGSDRENDTIATGVDLHIQKRGDACIFIEADTDNNAVFGEGDIRVGMR